LMHLAGIRAPLGPEKQGKGRQFKALGFHSLRHSFISTLANSEVPADVRKQIVGHSSEDIHRRYVHLDLLLQEKAIANGQGQYLRGFLVETSVRPKNLDLGSLVAGLQADTASKSLRLLCRSNLAQ
jgi:hypothetical protein